MSENQALIIDGALEVEVRAKVELTGGQLGALFWRLNGEEQAEFFSALASAVAENSRTPAALHIQMQYAGISTDDAGREVMKVIGECA